MSANSALSFASPMPPLRRDDTALAVSLAWRKGSPSRSIAAEGRRLHLLAQSIVETYRSLAVRLGVSLASLELDLALENGAALADPAAGIVGKLRLTGADCAALAQLHGEAERAGSHAAFLRRLTIELRAEP